MLPNSVIESSTLNCHFLYTREGAARAGDKEPKSRCHEWEILRPIDKDGGYRRPLSVLQVLPCQTQISTTALGIVSPAPRAGKDRRDGGEFCVMVAVVAVVLVMVMGLSEVWWW